MGYTVTNTYCGGDIDNHEGGVSHSRYVLPIARSLKPLIGKFLSGGGIASCTDPPYLPNSASSLRETTARHPSIDRV